jgi:hypothetical protein
MSASRELHELIALEVTHHGVVRPPWDLLPMTHPISIAWRMGAGESHIMMFASWWRDSALTEAERIAYFKKWKPPARWLAWMIDVIWDLQPWDHTESEDEWPAFYQPYVVKLEGAGFATWKNLSKIFKTTDGSSLLQLAKIRECRPTPTGNGV